MAPTIRNRFVALDRADDWIETTRVPLWALSAPDATASLTLTMFPVAEGSTMNLATLRALEHERHRAHAEYRRRARRRHAGPFTGRLFVDETSWTEGATFCVASTAKVDFQPLGFRGHGIERVWTVSDGKHVLQATLRTEQDAFESAVAACEAMMHSVRFEGPS